MAGYNKNPSKSNNPNINTDADASAEKYPVGYSTTAYGICKGAKNAKGAAYFLRYFLNKEHYDVNQIYKTEEALAMANQLNELADISFADFSRSINCSLDPSYRTTTHFLEGMISGTAAQVDVNLDSATSKFNGAIDAANSIIVDVR